jgi:hypothetical protein
LENKDSKSKRAQNKTRSSALVKLPQKGKTNEERKQGRMADAWALRGEEGRDKLRKVMGRCK